MVHDTPPGPVSLPGRNGAYTVTGFPPEPGLDWSLKDFYTPEDAARNPALRDRLALELSERGITEAFGPSIAYASGEVVYAHRLNRRIDLGRGVTLRRDQGVFADGVVLPRGSAFIGSIAGPVVIISGDGMCIAASAARDSLIDRQRVLKSVPGRKHASVIDAAMAKVSEQSSVRKSTLTIAGYFCLATNSFGHPLDDETHGFYNRRLVPYARSQGPATVVTRNDVAYLSLTGLILAQAKQHQIPHALCEHPIDHDGRFAHPRHHDPRMRTRNLVIVHHH